MVYNQHMPGLLAAYAHRLFLALLRPQLEDLVGDVFIAHRRFVHLNAGSFQMSLKTAITHDRRHH